MVFTMQLFYVQIIPLWLPPSRCSLGYMNVADLEVQLDFYDVHANFSRSLNIIVEFMRGNLKPFYFSRSLKSFSLEQLDIFLYTINAMVAVGLATDWLRAIATLYKASTRFVKRNWTPFQYPISRVRSREVSKPRDWCLELSDRSDICRHPEAAEALVKFQSAATIPTIHSTASRFQMILR